MSDYVTLVALNTVISVVCLFSAFGSLIIILTYLCWPDVRTTSRLLLVFLSIADFVTAVGNCFGVLYRGTDIFCKIQSGFTTLSSLCSFFWTVCIGVYLYICLQSNMLADRFVILFNIISWGLPSLLIILAASFNVLGGSTDTELYTGGWCWIRSGLSYDASLFWHLFAGKGWEVATYFATCLIYILIRMRLRRKLLYQSQETRLLSNNTLEVLQQMDRKLIWVPVIFVFIRIWGTIRFFLQVGNTPESLAVANSVVLILLQGIGDSIQGFFNCILFCFFTKKVRKKIFDVLRCRPTSPPSTEGYPSLTLYQKATPVKEFNIH